MNPLKSGYGTQPGGLHFRKGRNSRSGRTVPSQIYRDRKRNTRSRIAKRVKLRDSSGFIQHKKSLKCSLLNVNGLSEASMANVKDVLSRKQPDVCILLETKRRLEDEEISANVDGYELTEYRRSDLAFDKAGGGLAIYTRKADGLVFKDFDPDIADPAHLFVRKERAWKTVETVRGKTAICGVYAGFQAADDRHGDWNESLFSVISSEISTLRSEGFRVILLGDFNAHVGNEQGVGIAGNHPDINRNGRRFLNLLSTTNCAHINGLANVTTGLWTRQQGGVSSVLDYGVVAREHLESVQSLYIDDQGNYGGGSDHNWVFLDMTDNFVKKVRVSNFATKKQSWKISEYQDWSGFASTVSALVDQTDSSLDSFALSKRVADILINAGKTNVGYRTSSRGSSMAATTLPRALVNELDFLRQLERNYKSKASNFSSLPVSQRTDQLRQEVLEAERLFTDQQRKVKSLLFIRKNSMRTSILKKCAGTSAEATRCFWSHLNKKAKKSSEIDAVLCPDTGVLHCQPEHIATLCEKHLQTVFQGSIEPFHLPSQSSDHTYCSSRRPNTTTSDPQADHPYSSSPSPKLPSSDGSKSIQTDPDGWINRDFTYAEVVDAVKKLKRGKAVGVDNIPNEFIINAGEKFWSLLTVLYNKVKTSGKFPPGWNSGRVSLVHKRGLREKLGNYRPLTVIISLSGLYSRLLNERLIQVVEQHRLLGEIQNGFRKGRTSSDNAFVLDTILWKEKARRKKVHLAFLDLVKAYDTVNRDILWRKLSGFGFGGDFLASLQAIYSGDSVQTKVGGISTRSVYLRRGLRQGCSLSPILFALYISEMGQDICLSNEGFRVGREVVSGLFFADDLVLLAREPDGLLRLLTLVKRHADSLCMKINTDKDKSEVISPDGEEGDLWQVMDGDGNTVLSLCQVLKYKYLGTTTMDSMHKIGTEKQKQCITKAHRYKGSCMFMSRDGPDVVDMIMATWCNVAIPAILYGTEMVPFSETTILEIERTQNQIAKYALGLPLSTPGICAQFELGMKSFRHLLYEHQLKFYVRVLNLDERRWVKQALLDHLSMRWRSPYVKYIHSIRTKVGLFDLPMKLKNLSAYLNEYFVCSANAALASYSLPWIKPIKRFRRQEYVREAAASTTISEFRYNVANMGHRYPRIGQVGVHQYCPLCPGNVKNSGDHLAMFCPAIEYIRANHTSVSSFRNICLSKGFSDDFTYELFVNGLDWNKNPVEKAEYLERGEHLAILLNAWLSKW